MRSSVEGRGSGSARGLLRRFDCDPDPRRAGCRPARVGDPRPPARLLVFALGFDIYRDDPQSQVAVGSEGFHRLGQAAASLNLPTVVIQEGGYHLESLAWNTRQFFTGMLRRRPP